MWYIPQGENPSEVNGERREIYYGKIPEITDWVTVIFDEELEEKAEHDEITERKLLLKVGDYELEIDADYPVEKLAEVLRQLEGSKKI